VKLVDNKKVFFIIAMLMLLVIVYFNHNKEVLLTRTNTSAEHSNTSNVNKQKDNVTSSADIISNEDFYKKFTLDQKIEIKLRCNEYFYAINNGINFEESFREKYKNPESTQNQQSALKKLIEKCHLFSDLQNELEADFLTQENNLSNEQNKQYYLDLSKSNGKEDAIGDAKINLLSLDSRNRHSAKMFLHESGWLTDLNEELDIEGLKYNDAFGIFDTALEIRMCELGMVDCSSDSFSMLVSCQNLPETCGMDVSSASRLELTGFELIDLEKYLHYIRMLNY